MTDAPATQLYLVTPPFLTLLPFGDLLAGLLDAVEVAGEAGGDDPPARVLVEQLLEHRTDAGLAGRVPMLFGICAVGEEEADAFTRGECAESGQIRAPAIHRGEVELEVTRVQHDALRSVQDDSLGVGHRVGDGQ